LPKLITDGILIKKIFHRDVASAATGSNTIISVSALATIITDKLLARNRLFLDRLGRREAAGAGMLTQRHAWLLE